MRFLLAAVVLPASLAPAHADEVSENNGAEMLELTLYPDMEPGLLVPMSEGVIVNRNTTYSGSTPLSSLATDVDALKASHGFKNSAGYPFVPYDEAEYTLQSSSGKTIDTFWQTVIKKNGETDFVTVDSTTNFYAYATDGNWYDIYTGELIPAGWSETSRSVAIFGGKMGSASTPYEYVLPSNNTFTVAGMIVGRPTEASYVNIISGDSGAGTIIFEKTEADKAYNELTVNLFVYGSLELSGFDGILVNSSILVNKSTASGSAKNLQTGALILDASLTGGTTVVNGVKHTNAIYFEATELTMRASNEEYVGDWYFGMYTSVKFDFHNATSNQFGSGALNFRGTYITFAGTEAQLSTGDVYVTLGNNIKIDGAPSLSELISTWDYKNGGNISVNSRGVTVAESARDAVFNYDTNAYNRFYRTISGDISDGSRGVGKFIWANRSNDNMGTKIETWVFTGDNSNYGSTAWYQAYRNNKAYALWDLGTSTYNSANIGIAMPIVFGDGSDFAYGTNYDAIAGFGGFTANSATVAMPSGNVSGHTGVGFNYSNAVKVNNAIFGTIRVYHLGAGTLELTNKNNDFDAGVWVTNGGTLSVSDLSALGTGGLNIISGTLKYTGESAEFNYAIDNQSAIVRLYDAENSTSTTYEQKHFGNWAVDVTNASANLSWDATKTDSYAENYGTETGVRSGDFTKLGEGTFTVSAGTLVNTSKWTYDSAGVGTQQATGQYKPNVTIAAGTLAFTGEAQIGNFSTIYMNDGKLASQQDITLNDGQNINLSAQTYYSSDGDYFRTSTNDKLTYAESVDALAGTFHTSDGTTVKLDSSSSDYATNFITYSQKLISIGKTGLIEFKTKQPSGSSGTSYYYAGQCLYYKDNSGNKVVVGREKVGSSWVNTTDPAKLLAQIQNSYSNSNCTIPSVFNGGSASSLDDFVIKNGDTYISGSIALSTNSDSASATAPTGTEFGTWAESVLVDVGKDATVETDGTLAFLKANEQELHDQLLASGVLSHKISVGTGAAGTLTLAGGTLTYEFTNITLPDYTVAVLPSWNYIALDGKFAVDAVLGGNIEFVFKNGAMLTEGFYKLLEAASPIDESVIENLKIIGISSLPGNANSRQTIELLLGSGAMSSLGYHIQPDGGTANELYAYVTPSTALLHWNTTDGIWEQKNSTNGALANNWTSLDSKVSDTNFYENDSVVFCDLNHQKETEAGGDQYCKPGDGAGTTHTVTISGNVKPLQMIVSAEKDNYVFTGTGSIGGEGRLDKSGAGTLTIYTSNTFTGGTNISAGTVNALATNALGSGLIHVYQDGTLNVGAIAKDNFGTNTSAINNVLVGSIHLESAGTINIFGSNNLTAGSTVNISGGELHANATGALKNATINVIGGAVYANAANAFDTTNTITLAGTADSIAQLYVTESNALGYTDIVVGAYSQLIAQAGQINAGTITLKAATSADQRDGALIIDAEHPLQDTNKIIFDNGGVIVLERENTTHDISLFDNYEVKSQGSSFGVGINSNLIVAGSALLEDKISILKKFGSGALTINVDAGKTLGGSISLQDTIHSQLGDSAGTIIFNFGSSATDTMNQITGAITGSGTIRTEGGHGAISSIITGSTTQHFEYAAASTQTATRLATISESDLAKYNSTTKFVSGEIHINAIAEGSKFYTGTIVNGTSAEEIAAEKAVTISSQIHNTNIAVTQNTGSGTLYATVKDNGNLTTGLEVHSTGSHVLTLAAKNTSTGTLSIFEKATVEIDSEANWAGAIHVNTGGTLIVHADESNISTSSEVGTASINISNTLGDAGTVTFESGANLILDLSGLSDDELLKKQNKNGIVALKIAASAAIGNYINLESINWDGTKFAADGQEIAALDSVALANASSLITYFGYDLNTGTLLLAIPEPSLFGMFAGICALALTCTRRRRK